MWNVSELDDWIGEIWSAELWLIDWQRNGYWLFIRRCFFSFCGTCYGFIGFLYFSIYSELWYGKYNSLPKIYNQTKIKQKKTNTNDHRISIVVYHLNHRWSWLLACNLIFLVVEIRARSSLIVCIKLGSVNNCCYSSNNYSQNNCCYSSLPLFFWTGTAPIYWYLALLRDRLPLILSELLENWLTDWWFF